MSDTWHYRYDVLVFRGRVVGIERIGSKLRIFEARDWIGCGIRHHVRVGAMVIWNEVRL